ncbi:MAG: AAA family ATPase [Desulfobacterales bacterium]
MPTRDKLTGFTIVVAGKGGTGKTLISSLLVRYFVDFGPVLAIDADPDSNLPEALGVAAVHSVGDIRESLLKFKTRQTENRNVTVDKVLEKGIMEAIVEDRHFDLLVMGRSEGEGCYCHINHILRSIIDSQAKNYSTIVIDSEAGLEHISRRTARNVDLMLIVSDGSAKGMATAARVKKIAEELNIEFGRMMVLANKIADKTRDIIKKYADEAGLELLGFLPFDPDVAEMDALAKPIWQLPKNSGTMTAAKDAFARIDDIRKEKMSEIRSLEI